MTRDGDRGRTSAWSSVLQPVRPGRRDRWRAAFRLSALARALLVSGIASGVAVGLQALHLPYVRVYSWGAGTLVGWLVSDLVAGRTRRAVAAERALPRVPEHTHPEDVPAPGSDGLRRELRFRRAAVIVHRVLQAGVLAGGGWLAADPTWFGNSGERVGFLALVVLLALGVELVLRPQRRALRHLRGLDVAGMPVGLVTVLGFTGFDDNDVVIVPGATSAGAALAELVRRPGREGRAGPADTADRTGVGGRDGATEPDDPALSREFGGPVFAGPIGLRPGTLVAGDVLVCRGVLEPGGSVLLANRTGSAWATPLRVPYRVALFGDEDADAPDPAGTGPGPGSPLGPGLGGRAVRVVPAYGTPDADTARDAAGGPEGPATRPRPSLAAPPGYVPPWGSARSRA